MSEAHQEQPGLRRTLGLWACTMMGLGVILGAGVYSLVGKAAGMTGNAVWISFLGAAFFAGLTGMSYAELSGLEPRAGGVYHYVRRAFGATPAFLVSWVFVAAIAALTGAVALGFAGYLDRLVEGPQLLMALGIIAFSSALLIRGIREAAWFAVTCTVLESIGLLLVIGIGAQHLGEVDLLETTSGLGGLVSATALIFFAYIGFEEIVQLAEETVDPVRTIPRAVLLSIALATVLYVAVAIAAVSAVGWEELARSDSPLADVVAIGGWQRLTTGLVLVALLSTANTVLVLMMSAARLLFGMARDGALPGVLGRVHEQRRSPWVATIVVALMAAAVTLSLGQIELVANTGNFALFVTFIAANAAVIVLRFREPDAPRPFRIPGSIARVPLIPVLGIATALVLMAQIGAQAALIFAGVLLTGIVVRLLMSSRAAGDESPGP